MTCAESLPPTAHPVQVGLVWRFAPRCSGLLGKNILRATGRQILSSSQKENCAPWMQVTQAPCLHQQTLSQIIALPSPPQRQTSGVTCSSSEVIQQSSHRSPLHLRPHFASCIEHCNDLPKRERWMGNSGTIIISNSCCFPFLKRWSTAFPCLDLKQLQTCIIQATRHQSSK